jgi:iron complex outermembrane receptor protein
MRPCPRARHPFIDPRGRRPLLGAKSSLSAAVLTALYSAPSGAAPAPTASEDNALQEVVVTASRRAVSAQDLPISITAVAGSTLEQAGIQDISGLARSAVSTAAP